MITLTQTLETKNTINALELGNPDNVHKAVMRDSLLPQHYAEKRNIQTLKERLRGYVVSKNLTVDYLVIYGEDGPIVWEDLQKHPKVLKARNMWNSKRLIAV